MVVNYSNTADQDKLIGFRRHKTSHLRRNSNPDLSQQPEVNNLSDKPAVVEKCTVIISFILLL